MLYRIVPESPRWLIIKGRMKEAKAIINQVGLENRRPEVPDNLIISKSTGETGGQTEVDMEGESSVLTVLRCPRLGLRTLNMCYQVTHNEGWQIKLVLLLSYFQYSIFHILVKFVQFPKSVTDYGVCRRDLPCHMLPRVH